MALYCHRALYVRNPEISHRFSSYCDMNGGILAFY